MTIDTGCLLSGTILGVFLLVFSVKTVGGTAAFFGALLGEAVVILCFTTTSISFLWYDVVSCLATIVAALLLSLPSATRNRS